MENSIPGAMPKYVWNVWLEFECLGDFVALKKQIEEFKEFPEQFHASRGKVICYDFLTPFLNRCFLLQQTAGKEIGHEVGYITGIRG